MKSRKLRPIKDVTELKAGLYLRAYVNWVGRAAVETVLLVGKPYKKSVRVTGERYWVTVNCFDSTYPADERYVLDLIGVTDDQLRLYPFSNRAQALLLRLSADPYVLASFLDGVELTDEMRDYYTSFWEQGRVDRDSLQRLRGGS